MGKGAHKHHDVHSREIRFQNIEHCPRDAPTTLGCIPGYTGHIQGKISENVVASTVRKANELAATSRNFTPSWTQIKRSKSVENRHIKDRATNTGPGKCTSVDPSWRLQQFGETGGSQYSHAVKVPNEKP